MFDFTESIVIDAAPDRVWKVLRDVDHWWLQSNPEHISLEHLDDRPATEVGALLRIREKIGGVPGEAIGTITQVEPGVAVKWEADATYRWLGASIDIGEGVIWRIQPQQQSSVVSARVWARWPHGVLGRLAALVFVHVLNGEAKDREHTRTELRHLKCTLEGG